MLARWLKHLLKRALQRANYIPKTWFTKLLSLHKPYWFCSVVLRLEFALASLGGQARLQMPCPVDLGVSRLRLGPSTCVSSKFPATATAAAGHQPQFEDHTHLDSARGHEALHVCILLLEVYPAPAVTGPGPPLLSTQHECIRWTSTRPLAALEPPGAPAS